MIVRERVLVVGAQPGSLGEAVVQAVHTRTDFRATTAGLGEEQLGLNLLTTSISEMRRVFETGVFRHVVCTAGMNQPESKAYNLHNWWEEHYLVNCVGPMRLLEAWWQYLANDQTEPPAGGRHYVAISSNSARVPRSDSAAYCASKAALSQALRVKAREAAVSGTGLVVYGYEPGLVAETPMTEQTRQDFPDGPLTRMRPPELAQGLSRHDLAGLVVAGLGAGQAMNGLLVPFDADER